MKFKRFISGVVSLSIMLSMFTAAHANEITIENMQSTTFIRQGKVETLINSGDRFYQKTEYFDYNGEYTQPAKEHEITYSEYTSLRSSGSYDIVADIYQQTVDNVYVDMNMYRDTSGSKLVGAYIGRVIDGDFGEITTAKNNKTILINDNDEIFYVVEKFMNDDGSYARDATYTMATVSNYNKIKDAGKFDYEIQYTYELINDIPYKITGFYDIKGDPIIRPIIVEVYAVENMDAFFKEIEERWNPNPSETPDPNETPGPDETPNPNESPEPSATPEPSKRPGDGPGTGNGSGNGSGNQSQPWGGSVFNWTDGAQDAISSEVQNWADSWLGVTTDSSWFDSINGSSSESNGSDNFYNPGESEFGYIDDNGQFIATDENGNVLPTEQGTFDENGNFTPSEGDGEYYDPEGVLHPAQPTPSESSDGNINKDGNVTDGNVQDPSGLNNPDGSFNQGSEGTINSDGNLNTNENIQAGGKFLAKSGSLLLDEFDRLYIKGSQETYDATGLVTRPNGKTGYYSEDKTFNEGTVNLNSGLNGFYDHNGKWHTYNEFYITDDASIELVLYPAIGMTASDNKLHLNGYDYDQNGLTTKNDKVGYFNTNGDFTESNFNPYKNGFFDDQGDWIDDSLYTWDGNTLNISSAYFDPYGTFTVPNLDRGHFDSTGKFILGEKNVKSDEGYYDYDGKIINWGVMYTDSIGYIHETGKNGYWNENGDWVDAVVVDGVNDNLGNFLNMYFSHFTPNGVIGHYEDKTVIKGYSIYQNGYYNAKGEFFNNLGSVIADGQQHHYDKDKKLVIGINVSAEGYYDSEGNFMRYNNTIITNDKKLIIEDGTIIEGMVDANGNLILPDGTVITPDGAIGKYDENGNFVEGDTILPEGAYIDENGNIVMPDGTIIMPDGTVILPDGTKILPDGTTILPDGTVILPDGTVGYFDENGNFVEELPEGAYIDENGNIVMPDGTIIMPDGTVVLPDGTQILPDGTKILPDGTTILPDGTIITPGDAQANGYYDADGVWHELPVTALPGGAMHYDENGNLVEGENPYEGGYYDADGNWHPEGENYYIDKDGNIHMTGDGSIGYIDENGNFYPIDGSGYYDTEGNFHGKDGQVGYYDKDGNFHEGLNPYEGGYYDADGNWHEFGDTGYYDSDGLYHPSVTEEDIYHYDENGNLVEGENPYINGHYDENGNFIGLDGNPSDETPITRYYDENGNLVEGVNPYEGGYYDSQGNWHADGQPGYFDKNGNYIQDDGTVGYFDSNGNFHEGTNPYQGGYYDAEGNWHPDGNSGYFDKNGNYHSADGQVGYYDANGVFHLGENPYEGGYYDAEGNWHPFGANGYYDADGVWHDQLVIDSRYAVGGSDYILYEGYFRDPMMRNRFIKEGNTIQFTVNKKLMNPIYVDTGFYVSANAVLEYDEAQDVLHGIAIGTGNTFVKDEDACILVYNGKVVSLSRDSAYVTVQKLKEMFVDTNIGIDVRKSRVGGKYAFVDAVETEQNITLNIDGTVRSILNPLIVRNNQVYIALEEFEEESAFDMRMKNSKNEREVTLRRKNKAGMGITSEIRFTTNGGTISVESSLGTGELELINSPVMYNDKVYIPVNLLPQIVEKKVVWDAMNFQLCLTDYDF